LANSFITFCHRISYISSEALGSLDGHYKNNGLNLVWAPDISHKHCNVPVDGLVLETTATQQGLRLDKGIEPALGWCMSIIAFCQNNSHYSSTNQQQQE